MRLAQTYQTILDGSFRKRFPDWDQMTPLDPMKAFAESVSASLADIEKRQVRLSDLLINSLPAFFGFHRKPSLLQRYYCHFKATQSLRSVHTVAVGSEFPLTLGTRKLQAVATEAFDIFPVESSILSREAQGMGLTFSLRGGVETLRFFMLASTPTGALASARLTARLANGLNGDLKSGKTLVWNTGDLNIKDSTHAGTQNGFLDLSPQVGAPLFPSEAADYQLSLTYPGGITDQELLFNVASLSICQIGRNVKIATLSGDPWEQVPLSDRLVKAPVAVRLALPHDELTIHQVEMDILKIRTCDPDRFEKSFFYEPFSHSLIFPGAHRLVGESTLGVALFADTAISAVPPELLISEAILSAGDHRVAIETAKPLVERSPFVPHEAPADFLKRFYAAVRQFSVAQAPSPGVIKEALQHELNGAHQQIRTIELELNSEEKTINVHTLIHGAIFSRQSPIVTSAPDRAHPLPAGVPEVVIEALSHTLAQRTPLDYRYQITPFRQTEVEVKSRVTVSLPPERVGVVTEAIIKERLESALRHLIKPESLLADTALTRTQLQQHLRLAMVAETPDHTHLRPAEIDRCDLLIREVESGVYLDSLHRDPGQIFALAPDTTVELLAVSTPLPLSVPGTTPSRRASYV